MSNEDKPENPRPGKRQYFSSTTSPEDILANLRREHETQEKEKNEPGATQDATNTDPSSSS